MKKLISLIAACAALAFVSSAFAVTQIKDTSAGYQIADSATQKVGFFGATPVVQPTAAAQAALATTGSTNVILTLSSASITYAGVDGSTNTISVVTNVAVNAVWGYGSAGQANGFTTLVNAIRSALVSLGLLKGS